MHDYLVLLGSISLMALAQCVVLLGCLWLVLKIFDARGPWHLLAFWVFIASVAGLTPWIGTLLAIAVLSYTIFRYAGVATPLSAMLTATLTIILHRAIVIGVLFWITKHR